MIEDMIIFFVTLFVTKGTEPWIMTLFFVTCFVFFNIVYSIPLVTFLNLVCVDH